MNEIAVFSYEGNDVRTIQIDGEPWWVLRDICDVLQLTTPGKVAERLEEDEVSQTHLIDSIGRRQETIIVSESGLYNVILRSDKPEAKKFKRWVTHEVLPSIRRHGIYATEDVVRATLKDPAYIIGLLTEFQKEQEAHKATAALLEEKAAQLDESMEWFTVKRVASINRVSWKSINWKNLKNTSKYMNIPIKKVFDANYSKVNAYHIDVWKHEYAGFRYGQVI